MNIATSTPTKNVNNNANNNDTASISSANTPIQSPSTNKLAGKLK